jgi:hypothetical protein
MVEVYPLDRYHFISCLDGIQKDLLVRLLWVRISLYYLALDEVFFSVEVTCSGSVSGKSIFRDDIN